MGNVKRKKMLVKIKNNAQLLLLCIPALAGYILFNYVPMAGAIIAFKKYTYKDGIFGSKWIGLKNFELFIISEDVRRILLNTMLYSLWFLVLGLFLKVVFSILLAEISSRKALKFFQTCITLPNFLSWVVVGFVSYTIFHPSLGIMNQLFEALGTAKVDVYSNPKYWPLILTVFESWKGVGMGSIVFYASLMGIDSSLYEAAAIDGANRFQQIWYISLPHLVSLVCIYGILGMGSLFGGDFGLFYQIPRNIAALYETTDVMSTYLYRGIQEASYGMNSAVSLTQSVLGFVMVLVTNLAVKKISPENSMF